MSTPENYTPEMWSVRKDAIYAAIVAVQDGLEYARECLVTHDKALGRTTLKSRRWAESIERDIAHMESTLKMLRECGPSTIGSGGACGEIVEVCWRCGMSLTNWHVCPGPSAQFPH